MKILKADLPCDKVFFEVLAVIDYFSAYFLAVSGDIPNFAT